MGEQEDVKRDRGGEQQVEVNRNLEDAGSSFGEHQRAVPNHRTDAELQISEAGGEDREAEELGRCVR